MAEPAVQQVFGRQPGDRLVVAVDLRQAQAPDLIIEVDRRDARPEDGTGSAELTGAR